MTKRKPPGRPPGVKVREQPPLATDRRSYLIDPKTGKKVAVPLPQSTPTWLQRGYYQEFPWEQVNYYVRERLGGWPAGIGQESVIHTEVIPRNQVLIITSAVFRGIILGPASTWDTYFVRDEYNFFGQQFNVRISGAAPYTAVPAQTTLFNTDINIPGLPFQIIAHENQLMEAVVTWILQGAPFIEPDFVAVRLCGMWVPTVAWNEFSAKMGMGGM